jgi:hypothetical protein
MVAVFILFSFYVQKKQRISQASLNIAEDNEKGFVGDIFTNIVLCKIFWKRKKNKEFIPRKNRKDKT